MLVVKKNETFFIRVWKPLCNRRVLNFGRNPGKESSKRTIYASGGLELLQLKIIGRGSTLANLGNDYEFISMDTRTIW